ncbi:hypothetical protein GCM10008023_05900 [Sphingomonas glacialis]|uniref:Phage major capsid protein n=1 Tax=Sphingomonas glacialis TaxID=658225 RepID=A0ABQ3LAE6_9SPHN|nr:hypothetical protein [Sphingomonas glacialis]GHH09339.1 hypothetical protein GCM10008023_05900 [Sphingomonas glacialis]
MNMIVSSAAFELAKLANGGDDYASLGKAINGQAIVTMTLEKAQATIDLAKEALAKPIEEGALSKSVTLATGAQAYDLRAPSLLFSPTITPLRNSLKRTKRPGPGGALHWKAISGLVNSPNLMGWVPEGRRAASITYTMADASQAYATIGTEDDITDEAKYAAEGFEDEEALVQMRSLYKTMQIEECALLHGNASVALGTPTAPTLSAAGSTATLPSLTYSVIVVALTPLGLLQATLGAGVVTQVTIASNDGAAGYTVNGGCSNKSASATQAVTLGQALSATTPYINGTAGYAWYVGAVGSETLQAITTINSATFSTPLAGSRQAATAIAADYSTNSIAFDGLVTQAFKNNAVAYIKTMATGTAGVGTQMTAVGNGEVQEIRDMLRAMWDQNRVSVTKLYVAAQELTSLTKLVLTAGSAPLLRINSNTTADSPANVKVTAGSVVGWYFNPYTADGGRFIPIIIHPNMVPGTIFGYAETLPATYMSNECPTVAEVIVRQDYYVEKWPKTARRQFYGTYCQEAVAVYAPFCLAIINNIAPTI